jgi:hypothetical protein
MNLAETSRAVKAIAAEAHKIWRTPFHISHELLRVFGSEELSTPLLIGDRQNL